MWNPDLLSYSHEEGRLFHKKWTGLSFAHEVEEGDDPVCVIQPVINRMRSRYGKRAARFNYVMDEADSILLLRTGDTSRGEVADLMDKLAQKWPDADAKLMLFTRQDSREFAGVRNTIHYDMDLDPDRMNEDPGYAYHCQCRIQHILNQIGVTSKQLFWCPNDVSLAPRLKKSLKSDDGPPQAKHKAAVTTSSGDELPALRVAANEETFSDKGDDGMVKKEILNPAQPKENKENLEELKSLIDSMEKRSRQPSSTNESEEDVGAASSAKSFSKSKNTEFGSMYNALMTQLGKGS